MTGFGTEERLTRNKLKAKGGSLINPRKFYMCLICGPKHLDYSENDLCRHYQISHEISPKGIRQLEEGGDVEIFGDGTNSRRSGVPLVANVFMEETWSSPVHPKNNSGQKAQNDHGANGCPDGHRTAMSGYCVF